MLFKSHLNRTSMSSKSLFLLYPSPPLFPQFLSLPLSGNTGPNFREKNLNTKKCSSLIKRCQNHIHNSIDLSWAPVAKPGKKKSRDILGESDSVLIVTWQMPSLLVVFNQEVLEYWGVHDKDVGSSSTYQESAWFQSGSWFLWVLALAFSVNMVNNNA